jgi:hypothetical protein
MAKAVPFDRSYSVSKPQPVGELQTLIERISSERGQHQCALIGFDFPIGIPSLYAKSENLTDFPEFLANLGVGDWKDFYEICSHVEEISTHRPFYPYNFTPKGTKKRQHLVEKLGLVEFDDLLRRCELSQKQHKIPAAGPLFWTLGAKAAGRGAIRGWRDVIAPAVKEQKVKLWPFHGRLVDLLQPGTTVIAETYPTQYHPWIFKSRLEGKGRLEVRKSQTDHFETWAADKSVRFEPELCQSIRNGFVDGKDDELDAFIGVLGMIEVALGLKPEGHHPDPSLGKIEGWILGQSLL